MAALNRLGSTWSSSAWRSKSPIAFSSLSSSIDMMELYELQFVESRPFGIQFYSNQPALRATRPTADTLFPVRPSSRHGHDVEEILLPVIDPPLRHEQHPPRPQRRHELAVVADDHHRPRPLRERPRDPRPRRRVQVVRGLVEQQQVVPPRDQLRQRPLRLLPTRERARVLPCDVPTEAE